jgi:hypothetical protein
MFDDVDQNLMARQVMVRVLDPASGKPVFRSKSPVTVEPGGGTQIIELAKVESAEAKLESKLQVEVRDADNDDLLDHADATLKIELDEWF